ncbi:MAG: hypothetical protein HRT98_02115 [Mycoplasmatales bacterium]|nr:hypothetical protein [Mycoplasmatales bacterium]
MFKKIKVLGIASTLCLMPVSVIATTSLASRYANKDFIFRGYRFSSYEEAIQFAIRNNIFNINTQKEIGSYNHFLGNNGYNALDERYFRKYIPKNVSYAYTGADAGKHYATRKEAVRSYLNGLKEGYKFGDNFTTIKSFAENALRGDFKNVVVPAMKIKGADQKYKYYNIANNKDRRQYLKDLYKKIIMNQTLVQQETEIETMIDILGVKLQGNPEFKDFDYSIDFMGDSNGSFRKNLKFKNGDEGIGNKLDIGDSFNDKKQGGKFALAFKVGDVFQTISINIDSSNKVNLINEYRKKDMIENNKSNVMKKEDSKKIKFIGNINNDNLRENKEEYKNYLIKIDDLLHGEMYWYNGTKNRQGNHGGALNKNFSPSDCFYKEKIKLMAKSKIQTYLSKKYSIKPMNEIKNVDESTKNIYKQKYDNFINVILEDAVFNFKYLLDEKNGYEFKYGYKNHVGGNMLIKGLKLNLNEKATKSIIHSKQLEFKQLLLLNKQVEWEQDDSNFINTDLWLDNDNHQKGDTIKVHFNLTATGGEVNYLDENQKRIVIKIHPPEHGYDIDNFKRIYKDNTKTSKEREREIFIKHKAYEMYEKNKTRIITDKYLKWSVINKIIRGTENSKITLYQMIYLQLKNLNPELIEGVYDAISMKGENDDNSLLANYRKFLVFYIENAYKYEKFKKVNSSLIALKHEVMREIYESKLKKVSFDPKYIYYMQGASKILLESNIFDAYSVYIEGSMMQTMYFKSYSNLKTFLLDYVKDNSVPA